MSRGLEAALSSHVPTDRWIIARRAIDRGELHVVENAIASDLPVEPFISALGDAYVASANRELERCGARVGLELYTKARRPSARQLAVHEELKRRAREGKKPNRFPGVPHDDAFIRGRAADLVVRVSGETRQAIREALLARYTRERRPETLVSDLRNTVGLDPRRARALRNYEDKLRDDGVKGVPTKVERYRDKLVRNRAETIARTESVAVENEARIEAWKITIDSGAISIDSEQEWITAGDPCPFCDEMDGQRVGVGEDFQSTRYGAVARPPLHPNCQCVVTLRSFR